MIGKHACATSIRVNAASLLKSLPINVEVSVASRIISLRNQSLSNVIRIRRNPISALSKKFGSLEKKKNFLAVSFDAF